MNHDTFKALFLWLKIMVFGPKTNYKISGRVLAFPFNSYLKIEAAMQIYVCDL